MKKHELLDMIGEVNEDYVLAAGDNVVKPCFRWKALAACAACAVLALCVYQVWLASQPYQPLVSYENDCAPEATQDPTRTLIQTPGLHDYILVEQDVHIVTTSGDTKISEGGADAPQPAPAPAGGYTGKNTSGQDEAAVQEEAFAQYEQLLLWMLGTDQPGPSPNYPEWFGGVWLDGEHLTVAIVDGLRASGLEAQITRRCGGTQEVLFTGAKYSQNYLEGLMDEVCAVFDQYGWIPSVIDANEKTNRVEVDIFAEPSDAVLAEFARLDPDGDAIQVRVFTSQTINTDIVKGPDPGGELMEPAMDPVDPEATPTPIDMSDFPAEVSAAPTGPAGGRPVRDEDGHDIPGAIEELPQAKYDVIVKGG